MDIDYKAAKAAEAKRAEESMKAFNDAISAQAEKERERQAQIIQLGAQEFHEESERQRRKMEREIKAETEAAAEKIRAKYEAESPAEWNESKEAKALRALAKGLFE